MFNLRSFEGKNVELKDNENHTFRGHVCEYVFAEDNAPEEIEAIILNRPTRDDGYVYENLIEFNVKEIVSIKEI